MKTKIKIIVIMVICSISIWQYNYSNQKNIGFSILKHFSTIAFADSESCMGGSYVNFKAKTGSICTCGNTFVTSQSCESGGNGCTEISCG
ncbi:MAG TPA: hypothetical protein VGK10_19530 [Prolixibacteraceae bacterium]|jgi:hypothetical protein